MSLPQVWPPPPPPPRRVAGGPSVKSVSVWEVRLFGWVVLLRIVKEHRAIA